MAIDYASNLPKTCRNVIEMTNRETKKVRLTNRRCLLKIIENLQCLCRQGQAIQGDTGTESNFYQLIKLRGRDDPALLDLVTNKAVLNIRRTMYKMNLLKLWRIRFKGIL